MSRKSVGGVRRRQHRVLSVRTEDAEAARHLTILEYFLFPSLVVCFHIPTCLKSKSTELKIKIILTRPQLPEGKSVKARALFMTSVPD